MSKLLIFSKNLSIRLCFTVNPALGITALINTCSFTLRPGMEAAAPDRLCESAHGRGGGETEPPQPLAMPQKPVRAIADSPPGAQNKADNYF